MNDLVTAKQKQKYVTHARWCSLLHSRRFLTIIPLLLVLFIYRFIYTYKLYFIIPKGWFNTQWIFNMMLIGSPSHLSSFIK